MVACLAFWLGAVTLADRHPYVRNPRIPDMPGPVLGGTHMAEGGRSVAPERDAPAFFTDDEVTELTSPVAADAARPGGPLVPEQRETEPMPASASAHEARPQPPTGRQPSMPTMPPQRTGEGDQAKRSVAGPDTAHDG